LKPKQPETSSRVSITSTPKTAETLKSPLRGALVVGGSSVKELVLRLETTLAEVGKVAIDAVPAETDLRAQERVAIDYSDA
ncbi:MAG: hypothetical protein JNN15_15230, partial [Blastocatellia bacterium]|nr:hypothetical protein [Blastocatellia bacterium]